MALLSTLVVVEGGLTPAYVAASAGGDKVVPGEDVFLHVKNGSGASINVTVDSATPCNYGFDHNLVVAVPAGQERMIGPFPPARYAGSDGLVAITYSAVGSVTVAAVRA